MYIRPQFIDNSPIFLYKEDNFPSIPDLTWNGDVQKAPILLKKNEKWYVLQPINKRLRAFFNF